MCLHRTLQHTVRTVNTDELLVRYQTYYFGLAASAQPAGTPSELFFAETVLAHQKLPFLLFPSAVRQTDAPAYYILTSTDDKHVRAGE